MRKKIYIWMILGLLFILLSGCAKQPKEPQDTEGPPQEEKPPSQELLAILPQDTEGEYFYNGFAEYGHSIRIDRVEEKPEQTIYHVTGEVDDPSGGEAKGNFNIRMEYIVDAEKITEKIIEGERMPHKLKELEVLRLPLEKGNTWEQKVMIDGKEAKVRAVIESIDVDPQDRMETYTVFYTVPMENMPNGIYEERRIYKKGVGLYIFENTIGKEYDFYFNYMLSFVDKK